MTDPETDPRAEGVEAHDAGDLETSNPYPAFSAEALSWADGWDAAAEAAAADE